jgi:hypothetical protein
MQSGDHHIALFRTDAPAFPFPRLCMLFVPEWLICHIAGGRGSGAVSWGCCATSVWAPNAFVRVWGLLDDNTLILLVVVAVRRTARAAAHAEEPEQASSQGEQSSQPGGNQHIPSIGCLNIVGFEAGVDRSDQDAIECRCRDGGSNNEERGDLVKSAKREFGNRPAKSANIPQSRLW